MIWIAKPSLVAAVLALGAGGGAWLWFDGRATEESGGLLPWTEPERVANGRKIYDTHCAACHGAELEGEPDWQTRDADGYLPAPPHDATGHTWHHPDAVLIAITRQGSAAFVGDGYQSRMIGFDDILSDAEIRDVLAYIKSTWPDRIIETHNAINAQARE